MSKEQADRIALLKEGGWKVIPSIPPVPPGPVYGGPIEVEAPDGKRFIVDAQGNVLLKPNSVALDARRSP